MAKLSNSPAEVLRLELERRKSFAFRLLLLSEAGVPVSLQGCSIRFVLKPEPYDDDQYDQTNIVVSSNGLIGDGDAADNGIAMFGFQAAELDQEPGTYYGTLVLRTATGYTTTLLKLLVKIAENTESDSIHYNYDAYAPVSDVEVRLRGTRVVNVHVGNVNLNSITRGPCIRTTPSAIDLALFSVTSLEKTEIDDQTYSTGGPVELAVGDLIIQRSTTIPVIGRVMKVGVTTIQLVTIVGPGGA